MIAIACDHAAYDLKLEIINHLKNRGLTVKDFGTNDKNSCDYSDFAYPAAKSVAEGECQLGILICGTGIGMSITANKVKGIRCALCGDCFSAQATRNHNDANMLALGARVIGAGLALKIVDTFLDSVFEGGRHQRRIDKINEIEKTER
jgi:ribose 5-phosphate isomerase B